jgi:hypothetical protein
MSYIGNSPTQSAFVTDLFNGDGSTTAFTMSVSPANPASILVAVSGVLQSPDTYSVSGQTLNFSAAPPSATGNISVRYLGIPASGVTTTAYRTITEYTATAGQTTFTPPSYTVGFINVFRNGVMLGSADYTATNGTSVVLASGASSGDLVSIESFYVSSVLNAIPATANSVIDLYVNQVTGSKLIGSQSIPKTTLPTGSILQVLSSTDSTERATTSTSFVSNSNTLSVTITPTSSTSKFFISVSTTGYKNTDSFGAYTIYRNSTNLGNATNGMSQIQPGGYYPVSMCITDSPATASAITYQVYYKMLGGSGNAYINAGQSGQPTTGAITVMEIAA